MDGRARASARPVRRVRHIRNSQHGSVLSHAEIVPPCMYAPGSEDIETFVQAFPPVNIDVFDAAFTPVFVLVVCLGVLACCLCRSVTVIVTT